MSVDETTPLTSTNVGMVILDFIAVCISYCVHLFNQITIGGLMLFATSVATAISMWYISDLWTRMLKSSKRTRMKEQVESELVETEKAYIEGLEMLLQDLIAPIFQNGFINVKQRALLQSSIPEMLSFHQSFFQRLLKTQAKHDKPLVTAFYEMEAGKGFFIDIYLKFIQDYKTILNLLGSKFRPNKKLQAFLSKMQSEGKDFSDFMIRPIQRCPRYILLLKELLKIQDEKSEEFKAIKSTLVVMEEITTEINERCQKLENMAQCLQIQQSLKGSHIQIVDEKVDRVFIDQFVFIKPGLRGRKRIFYLFNDMLIVTNEDLCVKFAMNLLSIEMVVSDSKTPQFHFFTPGTEAMLYYAKDQVDCIEFRNKLSALKANLFEARLTNWRSSQLEKSLALKAKINQRKKSEESRMSRVSWSQIQGRVSNLRSYYETISRMSCDLVENVQTLF